MMMQIEITHEQAKALATLLNALRPDWDLRGILSAIYEARGKGGNFDLVVAAVRCASQPSNRTPAVIGLEGPHWQTAPMPAARAKSGAPLPPELCPRCKFPHRPGDECDVVRDELDPESPAFHQARADARAALAAARSRGSAS